MSHMFVSLLLYEVVEAVLWKLNLQYNGLFCADSTLAGIVKFDVVRVCFGQERASLMLPGYFFDRKIWKPLDSIGRLSF